MAHIRQRSLGDGWPPAGPKNDPDPNEPTVAPTQWRVLLHQQFMPNTGLWVPDFLAGPNPDGVSKVNQDGMAPGTYYTLTSATQFTGVG